MINRHSLLTLFGCMSACAHGTGWHRQSEEVRVYDFMKKRHQATSWEERRKSSLTPFLFPLQPRPAGLPFAPTVSCPWLTEPTWPVALSVLSLSRPVLSLPGGRCESRIAPRSVGPVLGGRCNASTLFLGESSLAVDS